MNYNNINCNDNLRNFRPELTDADAIQNQQEYCCNEPVNPLHEDIIKAERLIHNGYCWITGIIPDSKQIVLTLCSGVDGFRVLNDHVCIIHHSDELEPIECCHESLHLAAVYGWETVGDEWHKYLIEGSKKER